MYWNSGTEIWRREPASSRRRCQRTEGQPPVAGALLAPAALVI